MSRRSRSSYGRESRAQASAVVAVEPGGPADRAGVTTSDTLVTAEGAAMRDIIDWQWVADGPSVAADFSDDRGESRSLLLERSAGESWGIEFADAVFDGVRVCSNDCTFCFMTQLPRGMRSSLYLRDDDYRLSFLQGNFVTLTNLTAVDIQRIIGQRLSPLHVSVHAVDPSVRAALLCPRGADDALENLDALLRAGIEVHTQIVLVPSVNDGAVLEETLSWLAARDGVASVGIVPVGYTVHQEAITSSYSDPTAAERFLGWLEPLQQRYDTERGRGWLQAADEFFLAARRPVPTRDYYADFPQYENGIGPTRAFVDELSELLASRQPTGDSVGILTGTLFAPVLREALAASAPNAAVIGVDNRFFGGNVSVAGLLTAADIIARLGDDSSADRILVPDCIFNSDGLTLDDMTFEQLDAATDAALTLVSCDPTALVDALFGQPEEA
jgi:putative radical SAM enzyme (TIGR03279 family)